MKRIGNINPTLMNIHNNQLKILYVHTKESCTEKSGNINPNLINTHTNQLKILSVHITGLLSLSLFDYIFFGTSLVGSSPHACVLAVVI